MNTNYARLTCGSIEYAPAMLRTTSGVVANPSRMTYLAHGWKFLDIQPPADPPEGKEYVINGYTETSTDIRPIFKLVPVVSPPPLLPPEPASPFPNPKSPPSSRNPPPIEQFRTPIDFSSHK